MKIDIKKLAKVKKIPTQTRSRIKVLEILETSMQIIIKEGVGMLTTNKVAEYSGVSIGSIYQYYEDKESIIYEILNLIFDSFYQFYLDYSEKNRHVAEASTFFVNFLYELRLFALQDVRMTKLWEQFRVLMYHNEELSDLDRAHDLRMCEAIFKDALRYQLVPDDEEGLRRVRFCYAMLLQVDLLIEQTELEDRSYFVEYVEWLLRTVLEKAR